MICAFLCCRGAPFSHNIVDMFQGLTEVMQHGVESLHRKLDENMAVNQQEHAATRKEVNKLKGNRQLDIIILL